MDILITDAITKRKSFDIINALKYKNSDLALVLTHENKSLWSCIKIKILFGQYPVLLRKGPNFVEDLSAIINASSDLVYIPIEEDYTIQYYEFISSHECLKISDNLPSFESFKISRDKNELMKFCYNHSISVPKVFNADTYSNLKSNFVPIVIKPIIGCGASGVVFIEDIKLLPSIDSLDFDNLVIQERIGNPVTVIGMFYLYKNGKLVKWYGHKRIRTFPSGGGVTTYSKLFMDKEACRVGDKLLRALEWTGIAMVEMIFDPLDEKYKVIEVNPRFWGSVLLGEFAGFDFLESYIRTSKDKKVKYSSTKDSAFIRWFFPFDLLNYLNSGLRIKNFWNFNITDTCYVNKTYSSFWASALYIFFGIIDIHKIKTLIKKVFRNG